MTSSNGNIFRVTGPLCGEFTGPGDFPAQRPVTRSFDVFFDLRLNKRLRNNREAGDLRRGRGHYGVNVMTGDINSGYHPPISISTTRYWFCSMYMIFIIWVSHGAREFKQSIQLCSYDYKDIKYFIACQYWAPKHFPTRKQHVVEHDAYGCIFTFFREVPLLTEILVVIRSVLWRYYGRNGVSNHQPLLCLLIHSFRRRSIPRPNDQRRGKYSHLMTSSWCSKCEYRNEGYCYSYGADIDLVRIPTYRYIFFFIKMTHHHVKSFSWNCKKIVFPCRSPNAQ